MVEWVSYAINESEKGTYCYAKSMGDILGLARMVDGIGRGTALTYTGCTMLPPLAKAPEDLTKVLKKG